MVSSVFLHFKPNRPNFSHAGRYSGPIRSCLLYTSSYQYRVDKQYGGCDTGIHVVITHKEKPVSYTHLSHYLKLFSILLHPVPDPSSLPILFVHSPAANVLSQRIVLYLSLIHILLPFVAPWKIKKEWITVFLFIKQLL